MNNQSDVLQAVVFALLVVLIVLNALHLMALRETDQNIEAICYITIQMPCNALTKIVTGDVPAQGVEP